MVLQFLLHFYKNGDLVDKPLINLRDIMNLFIPHSSSDGFCDLPDAAVVYDGQFLLQFLIRQMGKIIGHQAVHMLFQRTDSLHQRPLKVIADAHHFPCRLHLRGERTLRAYKLIKRKPWNLYHAVVQHRLKTCIRLPGHCVSYLIQRIAQSNLGRNLGNGIAGSLGCQG